MTFAQWTTETTNADAIIHQYFGPRRLGPLGAVEQDTPMPAGPLVGSGSLQMQFLDQDLRGHIYRTRTIDRGNASGRIRTLCWIAERGVGVFNVGLYCRATSVNLIGASNGVYALSLTNIDGGRQAMLVRSAADGLDAFQDSNTDDRVVAEVSANAWLYETTFLLELAWQVVGSSLVLTYRQGSRVDGSDLTTRLSYTDDDVLLGPVTEGLWMATSTSTEATAFFDETGTYGEGE